MQPGNPSACGAQPDRRCSQPTGHRITYKLPKGVPLRVGRLPNERRQMPVSRAWPNWARDNHYGVISKIGELNYITSYIAGEVFRERTRIGIRRKSRTIQQNKLKGSVCSRFRDRRRLPSERRERRISQ